MKRKFWHFKCRVPLIHLLCFSIVLNGNVGFSSSTPHYHQEELPSDLDEEKVQYLEVDTWSLLPQELKAHSHAGSIKPEDVVISLISKAGKFEQYDIIRPRPYINAPTNPEVTFDAPVFSEAEQVHIELQFRNKPFWVFHKPILSIARYGNYIVFIEAGDVAEDNTALSFIDLSYFQSTLGSEEGYLPIFKMDIPAFSHNISISIQNKSLLVNNFPITRYILDEFGLVLTTTWNIQANLLSHETYQEQVPIIESLLEDLENGMQSTSSLFFSRIDALEDTSELQIDSVKNRLKNALESAQNYRTRDEALEASKNITKEFVIESPKAKQRIENALKIYSSERGVINKSQLMMRRLMFPRPKAGGTIREALGFVVGSLTGPSGERAWQIKEGTFIILNKPSAVIGASLAGALTLGYIQPDAVQDFFYQIIDWGGTAQEILNNKFRSLFTIIKEALFSNGTLKIPNMRVYFSEQWIGKWIYANLHILTILAMSFGVPHLAINLFHLRKAKINARNQSQNFSLDGHIKQREDDYYRAQPDDYIGSNPTEFTKEENEQVKEIIAEIKRPKSRIETFLSNTKKLASEIKDRLPSIPSIPSSSLSKFLFSWSALQNTYVAFTYFWWKYVYQLQVTALFKPHVLSTLLYYPNAFNIGTKDADLDHYKTPHPITNLNGGRRPFWRQHPLKLASLLNKTYKNKYDAYKQWEDHILNIEKMVLEKSQIKALELTTQNLEENQQLHLIRDLTENSRLYEMIEKLNEEQTKKYQNDSNYIFNKSIQKILKPVIDKIKNSSWPNCDMSYDDCISEIDEHKPGTLKTVLDIKPTLQEVDEIINEVITSNEFDRYDPSSQKVKISSSTVFVNNILYKSLNPHKNKQVERWIMTREQLEDPNAVRRNTPKTFYKFLQGIPEYFLYWVGASGIMTMASQGRIPLDDILVPLTDSPPYWSAYLFGMMFFVDFMEKMFNDFGLKMQEEYRHNKKGFFDVSVPAKETSFLKWYWQKIWDKDKKNTWWKNTKHFVGKMLVPNFPAYTTMYLITSRLILKRVDLDSYVMGYMIYLLFPTRGLIMKLTQGFEAAMTGYWYKYIPQGMEKLRDHPNLQIQIDKEKNKNRFRFQFFYFILYTNFVSQTLGTVKLIGFDKSRELARWLPFFGSPPTVLAVNFLEQIKEMTGLDKAVTWCQKALSNGYDGWMPSDDGPIPEWLKKPWQKP